MIKKTTKKLENSKTKPNFVYIYSFINFKKIVTKIISYIGTC